MVVTEVTGPLTASNRLPVLAGEIRKAHADVQDAAKTAAQRAIEAGHFLIEAKELVGHGQWLPWLRENCALAERTAQLYMKIAKSGLESATVADLGLQGAADAIIGYIDYWSDLSEADLVEWRAFELFLVHKMFFHIEGAVAHTEWLRRGGIKTVGQWFDKGYLYCWRKPPEPATVEAWQKFFAENCHRTEEDIEAELQRIAIEQGPFSPPERKKRTRRIRSDPKFTAAFRRAVVRSHVERRQT